MDGSMNGWKMIGAFVAKPFVLVNLTFWWECFYVQKDTNRFLGYLFSRKFMSSETSKMETEEAIVC
jgi:hypothetical protein